MNFSTDYEGLLEENYDFERFSITPITNSEAITSSVKVDDSVEGTDEEESESLPVVHIHPISANLSSGVTGFRLNIARKSNVELRWGHEERQYSDGWRQFGRRITNVTGGNSNAELRVRCQFKRDVFLALWKTLTKEDIRFVGEEVVACVVGNQIESLRISTKIVGGLFGGSIGFEAPPIWNTTCN